VTRLCRGLNIYSLNCKINVMWSCSERYGQHDWNSFRRKNSV